ncbi:hypothetical protein BGZ58_010750 [Dissophora ornata]|nr:hypothetical protein BGZ58_010750 [Dissophora ornata]
MLEALSNGTKLAVCTQVLLEHVDEIFGSITAAGPNIGMVFAGRDYSGEGDHGPESYIGKRVVQQQLFSPGNSSAVSSSSGLSSAASKSNKIRKHANHIADTNGGIKLVYKPYNNATLEMVTIAWSLYSVSQKTDHCGVRARTAMAFDHLKSDLQAVDAVDMPYVGQTPKDLGHHGLDRRLFVSEQILELWETFVVKTIV